MESARQGKEQDIKQILPIQIDIVHTKTAGSEGQDFGFDPLNNNSQMRSISNEHSKMISKGNSHNTSLNIHELSIP